MKLMQTAVAFGVAASLGLAFYAPSANAEVDKKIVRTFKGKCASCHGADGKGATEQGQKMGVRDMTAPAYQKEVTDARIAKAIKEGVKGPKGDMEAYADLDDAQIKGLTEYIRSLK